MKISADWLTRDASRAVMRMLEDAGYQALYVGGCVRNALLSAPVSDLDISTDARPETVIRLASKASLKAVPTGIDHGTVTIISDGAPYEVTTFRRDVKTDGRHAVIAFADSVEEDARRRDFTMNALYCDARGEVIDPLGGMPDLRARRVRFIDDPEQRIREDYLRILRFFRFTAWYGDGMDADGLAACAALSDGIEGLARERVGQEMLKLLSAPNPAPSVAAMAQSGVLWRVLPGADANGLAPLVHLEGDLAPDPLRRLAALGGEEPGPKLRLSKAQTRALATLKENIGASAGPAELGYRLGFQAARDVLLLRAALAASPVTGLDAARIGAAQKFPLTARDLMPALKGPELGAALAQAEAAWIASGFALPAAVLKSRVLGEARASRGLL